MPQLRHLIFFDSILPMPFAAIQNLQTLCGVKNFTFKRKAIEMFPNLKKLKVFYHGKSREKWAKYCLYNLVHLTQLETLEVRFSCLSISEETPFPASFALPPKLKKLTVSGCTLPWQDMAVIGSLLDLEVLKLEYDCFTGSEWESSEGQFPRLKFLLMEGLRLVCWRAESSHFPCLEQLIIKCCRQLEEIPCEIGDIPSLQLIEVDRVKKSVIDSAVLIQEEQRSLENDLLHVRINSE
ncbi:UNVERIFIED_CONTAM: putative late blight resistance proteinR1B-23 [Sesamum angustifolium]|uniref:Late blight resistance proteinR1B-23 n=1 Tax=Sesamum angustifolium TaxID=2727405 RepID=A0AAW2RLB5_9LAMI